MSHVSVRGLVRTFPGPVTALAGTDLEVPHGSLTAVLGPSGCGKSTLLRLIAGFERPDAGTVAIGGRTVAGPGAWVAPERRAVGIVPQEGALFPHLDVAGNIAFGLRGWTRAARRDRVDELLSLVELEGFGRRRPDELSGGQQQRVALARALAPRPEVVLLDEPFSALDAGLRAELRDQVADLLAVTGTTAVLVTHDRAEAFTVADVVAVMRAGRIIQVGRPQELYRQPADLEIAGLMGEAVTLRGCVVDGVVDCLLGPLPCVGADGGPAPAGDCTVLVRPEQIVGDPASPRRARATAVRFQGHDTEVHLDLDGHPLRARWHGAIDLARGDEVGLDVAGTVVVYPAPATGAAVPASTNGVRAT